MDAADRRRWFLQGVFVVCMLNFAAFLLVAMSIGGDAVNGRQSAGHYFVASHGKLTEVSRAVWMYSRAHSYSLFVTHPIGILAVVLAQRGRKPRR
jgi:hypothetical protein